MSNVFFSTLIQLPKVNEGYHIYKTGRQITVIRHERYTNQYRAMFVTNCRIIKSERYKDKGSDEAFYPVHCSSCDTHVAMMDEEEVYHFFNIIAT